MKDAFGHGSNGRTFGKRTPQPSVSNVEAIEALKHALVPPAPFHDAMSPGDQLVRGMRGGPLMQRGARSLTSDPIPFSYLKGRHK